MPTLDVGSHAPEDPVQELTDLMNTPQLTSARCLSAESYLDEDEALSTGELPTEDILAMVNRDTTEHKEHNDSENDQPENDGTPPSTS